MRQAGCLRPAQVGWNFRDDVIKFGMRAAIFQRINKMLGAVRGRDPDFMRYAWCPLWSFLCVTLCSLW